MSNLFWTVFQIMVLAAYIYHHQKQKIKFMYSAVRVAIHVARDEELIHDILLFMREKNNGNRMNVNAFVQIMTNDFDELKQVIQPHFHKYAHLLP